LSYHTWLVLAALLRWLPLATVRQALVSQALAASRLDRLILKVDRDRDRRRN
jgi:hypothetical protein